MDTEAPYSDTAKDNNLNYEFDASASYDVKITFTKSRCYIDINHGCIQTAFETNRTTFDDMRFYVRNGVDVQIDDVKIYQDSELLPEIPTTVDHCIKNGLISGFISYDNIDRWCCIQSSNIGATHKMGRYEIIHT